MKSQQPWSKCVRIAVVAAALAVSACNLNAVIPGPEPAKPSIPVPNPVAMAYPAQEEGKFTIYMVDVEKGTILSTTTQAIDLTKPRLCAGPLCAQLAILTHIYKTTDPIGPWPTGPGVPVPDPKVIIKQARQHAEIEVSGLVQTPP